MKKHNIPISIAGTLWLAPLSIPTLCLVVPLLSALGLVLDIHMHRVGAVWAIIADVDTAQSTPAWWRNAWRRWSGLALPHLVLLNARKDHPSYDDAKEHALGHEMRHETQWMLFGPLFPIAYLIGMIIGATRGKAYALNPFEIDARSTQEHPR